MDRFGWKYVLIEGPSDGTGIYIRLIEGISVSVCSQHFEQRVEVVRGLIDVKYKNRLLRSKPFAKNPNREAHGSQRVLSLRRSIVSNHDGLVPSVEFHRESRLFQQRHCQNRAASWNHGISVVGTLRFHNAMRNKNFGLHANSPSVREPLAQANSLSS